MRAIYFLLLFLVLGCNAQEKKIVENYTIHNYDPADMNVVEQSIEKASRLYKNYIGDTPKSINLYVIDSLKKINPANYGDELNNNVIFWNKRIVGAPIDTSIIINDLLKNLSNFTLVHYDSLSNITGYLTAYAAVPIDSSVQVKSKSLEKKTSGPKTKKFDPKNKSEVVDLAIYRYEKNNQPMDQESLYRFFLISNLYFDLIYKRPNIYRRGVPEWTLYFKLSEAENYKTDEVVKTQIKSFSFLRSKMKLDDESEFRNRGYFLVPHSISVYSEDQLFVGMKLAEILSKDHYKLKYYKSLIGYLKEQYGNDVISSLIDWQFDKDPSDVYLVTFLNEKYKKSLTLKSLLQDYNEWVKK